VRASRGLRNNRQRQPPGRPALRAYCAAASAHHGGEHRKSNAAAVPALVHTLGNWSLIHCENTHFSPEVGGRPAWRVSRSGVPSRRTLAKKKASPTFARKVRLIFGKLVSPPSYPSLR